MPFTLGGQKFPQPDEWKQTPLGEDGVPHCPTTKPRKGDLAAIDNALQAANDLCWGIDHMAQSGALTVLVSAADHWIRSNPLHTFQGSDKKDRIAAVKELRARADKSAKLLGKAHSRIKQLITAPNDINKELLFDSPLDVIGEKLWVNFMTWARANVQYAASSTFGGEDLLGGATNAVPCGGIATALRILFQSVLGNKVPSKMMVTIPGYLITKAEYKCFDAKVKGNVRDARTKVLDGRCIFNQHFYLQFSDSKFFDPCMNTTYAVKNSCIEQELKKGPESFALPKIPNRDSEIYFHHKALDVPGFNGSWTKCLVKDIGSEADLKTLLGDAHFNEMTSDDRQVAVARCVQATV